MVFNGETTLELQTRRAMLLYKFSCSCTDIPRGKPQSQFCYDARLGSTSALLAVKISLCIIHPLFNYCYVGLLSRTAIAVHRIVNKRPWIMKVYRVLVGLGRSQSVQCSAVQCSAVQCSAVQCSAVQCSAVQCSAVQCSARTR